MPKVIRFAGLLIAAGLATGMAAAADKKPNTLSPEEVAAGWIMLFDGETTFGWRVVEGEAKAKDGLLVVGGRKATKLESTADFAELDYRFQMKTADGGACAGGGLFLPAVPTIAAVDFTGLIDADGKGTVHGGGGKRGPVRIEVPAGRAVLVGKLMVRPAILKPLLNGKDLSGWKVFQGDPKRAKSKFEVTPAGELHVTNGPGDLQTEKRFADFVLQLECKTNGKNLNSGVFFRCVPNQYQNGYEAQIHNGFKDNDRTKPVDFGTGAIYRRVPARKVVSNDNEWFTMTVVANGPHIATWVNGYQTVDWTDDRKPADNPRQGLRTAAGHVSIQGHDPTTDILFRNIRIAELSAASVPPPPR
jgi:hypothetical protein